MLLCDMVLITRYNSNVYQLINNRCQITDVNEKYRSAWTTQNPRHIQPAHLLKSSDARKLDSISRSTSTSEASNAGSIHHHPATLKHPVFLHQFPQKYPRPRSHGIKTYSRSFYIPRPRPAYTPNQHKSAWKIVPREQFSLLPREGNGMEDKSKFLHHPPLQIIYEFI